MSKYKLKKNVKNKKSELSLEFVGKILLGLLFLIIFILLGLYILNTGKIGYQKGSETIDTILNYVNP